jgi:methionyl-tRNA formyltransferase
MQMDESLDTGPMLLRERVAIGPEMNAGALHDALAKLGARLIVEALEALVGGRLSPTPQPAAGVTYAAKIGKTETHLDWAQPAEALARQVRAFSPAPGAWIEIAGERVRILGASVVTDARNDIPGTVLDEHLTIACGEGGLRLEEVQRAGAKPLTAEAFLRGRAVAPGTVLA